MQTQVDDRKQAAAPTPDRLKLSQGGVKASAPEARASTDAQKRDEAARLAELARNVDELKKLQGATATAAPKPAGPATPAATPPAAAPPARSAPACLRPRWWPPRLHRHPHQPRTALRRRTAAGHAAAAAHATGCGAKPARLPKSRG